MEKLERRHLRKRINGPLDEGFVRDAIVDLARFACSPPNGRQKGDAVFERVTEGRQGCWLHNGRRRCYSACGDLPHFVSWLAAGAVRYDNPRTRHDLRWINRREAWGWRVQWNLIKLHAETGSAWTRHRKGDHCVAQTRPGDVWIIGDGGDQHAMVVKQISDGRVLSFDYGQFFNGPDGIGRHGGKERARTLTKGPDGRIWVYDTRAPGRPLYGRLNVYAALLHADGAGELPLAAALVPETLFKVGIPTDNPYFEPYFPAA